MIFALRLRAPLQWPVCATALFLAGCQTGTTPSSQSCELSYVTTLPLQRGLNQFFTVIRINGHDVRMLLDTGLFENVLTADVASRLGLHPDLENSGGIVGIGGKEATASVLANDVQLGRLHGKRMRFATLPSIRVSYGMQPDGFLGMNYLADFDMDIDLPAREISLFRAVKNCPRAAVTLAGDLYTTPLVNFGREFSPAIDVTVGGARLRAVIDTGAQHSTLFSDAADKIGIARIAGPRAPTHVNRGFGSSVSYSFSYILPEMQIGTAEIRNIPFEVLDHSMGDGTRLVLGADFLQKVHVWISRSSNTLVLQYPPRASPPIPRMTPAVSATFRNSR